MNIIDSLKRLETVGLENSIVTEKLKESADELAKVIIGIAPYDVELPMGYRVDSYIMFNPEEGRDYCLKTPFEYDNHSISGYSVLGVKKGGISMTGDFYFSADRDAIIKFAKDLSDGLLDKIADFIEQRKLEAEKAIETIEVVTENVKKHIDNRK